MTDVDCLNRCERSSTSPSGPWSGERPKGESGREQKRVAGPVVEEDGQKMRAYLPRPRENVRRHGEAGGQADKQARGEMVGG